MSETTRGPAEPIRYSAVAFKQTSFVQKIPEVGLFYQFCQYKR